MLNRYLVCNGNGIYLHRTPQDPVLLPPQRKMPKERRKRRRNKIEGKERNNADADGGTFPNALQSNVANVRHFGAQGPSIPTIHPSIHDFSVV
ncbi:hypothetical protein VTJ04DRAFT_6731 [Mycothermus thermophilus]|uniref:uncharacterized protein n=1 Tax=Humicola insolens TaxID=85995 RepID=UPI003741FD43